MFGSEGITPIAIVGLECRLPGAADATEYWRLLERGQSALGELPPDRLDRELYFAPEKGTVGKTYTTIGGIVAERPVTATELGLAGTAFENTDKAFLAICDVAARALRNAGLDPFRLPRRHAGVYLGSAGGTRHSTDWIFATLIEETAGYLRELPAFRDGSKALANSQLDRLVDSIVAEVRRSYGWREDIPAPNFSAHVAAHAISRAFGLTGPSMALDAACASSLQAMALGVQALRLGTIDMAIVGGVSCLKQHSLVLFSAAQSLTANYSRPFDAEADGLVAAEGYVAIVLKRLADAEAAGDRIRGVIRDIASASDGKGKSLWAPRKEGQILAIQRVYQRGIDIRALQYIEAHATSTQVGDATELAALAESIGPNLAPGQRIALGASKGNIGHTLETAGIAGVAKVLLALERQTIPPVAGLRQPNPKVPWDRLPFYLPTRPEPWPELPGHPRLASVNSFGIGGLNTHVVLEEYRAGKSHEGNGRAGSHRGFRGAALSGAALSGAALSGAALSGAALSGAALSGASVDMPNGSLSAATNQATSAGSSDPAGAALSKASGAASSKAAGGLSSEPEVAGGFEPIAIIGAGAILPGAFSVAALGELLETARDARRQPPEGRWSPTAWQAWRRLFDNVEQPLIGGFLDGYQYDWRKNKVPPKQVTQGNPLQFLLLDATTEALRTAGYDRRPLDRQRTAVVVGSIFRGDFCDQLQMGLRLPEFHSHLVPRLEALGWEQTRIDAALAAYDAWLLERMPALLDETGSFTSSTLASRITKAFDLMGGAVAIDAGEGSGLAAMSVAIDQLRRGDCDMVICAGANQALDYCAYQAIVSRGKELPQDTTARPFADHSYAAVPGEGVAVVVLKRLSLARRDHDPVLAVIRGMGVFTDLEQPARAVEQAIRAGLRSAQLAPSAIDVVETDGADGEDEVADIEGIAAVFGETPRPAPLSIRSLAGQIGQCGAAMGNAGVIAATWQLRHRRVLPGPPIAQPAAHVRRYASVLQPLDKPLPLQAHVGVLAGGGAGSSYFAILESGDMLLDPSTTQPAYAAELAAPSNVPPSNAPPSVVEHRIRDTSPPAPHPTLAASPSPFPSPTPLAAVPLAAVPLATVPLAAVPLVASTAHPQATRVVWLFPGQGSQYPGMLKTLAADCPAAAEAIAEADALLRAMGLETFTHIAWENGNGLGSDIWRTQLAMLVADYAMVRALTSLGAQPDMVAGHSFGELAALLAAGCWSLDDAIRAAWERADAQRRSIREPAGMIAVFASLEQVESLVAWASQPVFIANHNAPEQVVVGGSRLAIEQFMALAASRGVHATVLPVPGAFHTPLMAAAAAPFAASLAKFRLRTGRVPVISTATNRAMVDPADFHDSLVASLTAPVRYVDLIRRLEAEQPTLFVEVGPQRVLTKLNRKILGAERPHTLPTDDPQRSGIELVHQAAAACLGVTSQRSGRSSANHRPARPPGRLLHFDATEKRREARRQAATVPTPTVPTPTVPTPTVPTPTVFTATVLTAPESTMPDAAPRVSTTPVESPAPSVVSPPRQSPDALRAFLLRFVVEQTGYPEEMVELDSNLEADLGIDSIKKAQLFGEIAEQFQVPAPSGPVSLDDFPTLRHILDYLVNAGSQSPNSTRTMSSTTPIAPASLAPAPNASAPNASAPNAPAPNASAPNTSAPTTAAPTAAAATVPAPLAPKAALAPLSQPSAVTPTQPTTQPSPTQSTAVASSSSASSGQLREFLLRFVVEQTGYPEEMVELDSNLEADLGIDSIKKAQLFGEIAEQFRIPAPSGPVSLDDFPTLRHVLDYLAKNIVTTPSAPPADPIPDRAAEEAQRTMVRCVFELRDAPLATVAIQQPDQRLMARVVLAGRNSDCDALASALAVRGVAVSRLESPLDLAASANTWKRLWADGPLPALIIATARDAERIQSENAGSWEERLEPGLLAPFALCQSWFEEAMSDSSGTPAANANRQLLPTVMALTSLGGGFGFGTPVASPEGGGIAGLLKAMRAESQGRIRARVIDFPSGYSSQQLAEQVIAEFAGSVDDIEVGYDAQQRRRVVQRVLAPASALPIEPLPGGSVWLVTGGARGVTALTARELGRRFGCKLHLVGSSQRRPLEPSWRGLPRDQWKSLRGDVAKRARERGESPTAAWDEVARQLELEQSLADFAAAGVVAEYHSCDVADGTAVARLVADIRRRDRRIDGVLHGAGVEVAASFAKKRLENVRKTLAVKAGGAAHLLRLLESEPPRYFAAFSSVSGRFGGFGQTDYSMANDLLCKLVTRFADRHPKCRAVCLDWPAWDEIGMAARPESRFALQAMKVRFMPPDEGVRHLIDELLARGSHMEVAFVDRDGRAAHQDEAAALTPRDFGRQHRAAIVEFLRLAADQADDSAHSQLAMPPALQQALASYSDDYLREVAAGAEVALASLLAHRPSAAATTGPITHPTTATAAITVTSRSAIPSRPELDISDLPMIDAIVAAGEAQVTARSVLRPTVDIFLRDHLLHNKPFLPAVVSSEILAEAASLLAPGCMFAGFRGLEFLQGQAFASDEPLAVEATVTRTQRGWECELTGSGVMGGEAKSVLVRGIADFVPAVGEAPRQPVDNPSFRWNTFSYEERGYALVLHGTSLRLVNEIALQRDGGRTKLTARDPRELAGDRRGRRWLMPSALLDGCFVSCGTYAYIMLDGRYGLPRGMENLRIFALPTAGESCRCRFTLREENASGSWYDFHLVDSAGRCVAIAERYQVANLTRRK